VVNFIFVDNSIVLFGVIMGSLKKGLSNLLLGSPESQARKKAMRQRERAAYQHSYEQAKIQRARKEGQRAGSTTRTERVLGSFASAEKMLGNLERGFGSMGSGLFGEPPRKRTHKHKSKKGKTITIHVK
jgi:hypothetical protein